MAERMTGRTSSYGLSSLFACAARGDAQVLQNGDLQISTESGDVTLFKKVEKCCCYEKPGDNKNCPVHGGVK